MVQHASLTGAELHEGKGVAAAAQYTIFSADGAGSGAYSRAIQPSTVTLNANTPQATGSVNADTYWRSNLKMGFAPVLINTMTAANSASLQDSTSFTSTYRYYKIILERLVPVTNSVSLRFRPRVSGTYQASVAGSICYRDGGGGGTFQSSDGSFTITTNSNIAGWGTNGEISVINPAGGFVIASGHTSGLYGASAVIDSNFSLAYLTASTAWTGFQIDASSGNLSTGTVKVFGWNE